MANPYKKNNNKINTFERGAAGRVPSAHGEASVEQARAGFCPWMVA